MEIWAHTFIQLTIIVAILKMTLMKDLSLEEGDVNVKWEKNRHISR